jgi:NADPH2:quinone reductase
LDYRTLRVDALKAVLCVRFGPPEALEIAELPDPVPGPGEVTVEVAAAALNFFDTLIIAGRYQLKPELPFSPAAEFAGVVEAVGEDVKAVAPGDRVCGYIRHGAAREKVTATASALLRVPEGLELERAAGLFVTYGTTMHALKDRAQLAKGETLAVLGAAGGAGLAAVEIGKILGARVIACASSADKLAFARDHGADETVEYTREDLKERLRALTGGQGADVVFDPVGGPHSEAALRAIAWQGRHLVVGFAAGEIPRIPLNLLLLRGCQILGVYFGEFARRDPGRLRDHMEDILRWARDRRISAHIDSAYPLERTAEALNAIMQRRVKGKVVLTP